MIFWWRKLVPPVAASNFPVRGLTPEACARAIMPYAHPRPGEGVGHRRYVIRFGSAQRAVCRRATWYLGGMEVAVHPCCRGGEH